MGDYIHIKSSIPAALDMVRALSTWERSISYHINFNNNKMLLVTIHVMLLVHYARNPYEGEIFRIMISLL